MSHEEAWGRLRARVEAGDPLTEVHIVNGLHGGLPFDYYEELLRGLKRIKPSVHLKAFTAVEIFYFHQKFGLPVREVLERLRAAGMDSLPGGGAEIFAPRVRKKICDDKCTADQWLDVHRTAHRLGLRSNCTMLYGHIESDEDRVDHLLRLRALQDETGGFQTFIPLAFHPDNNSLMRLPGPTGVEDLRLYAVSRLMLHNIPHIKAYWIMLGVKTAQTALWFGADDLDGTVQEERIYHMAGAETPQAMTPAEIVRLIANAGRVPVERDTLYNVIAEGDALASDKPFRRAVRKGLEVVQ
jgi:aminodeoxyfutalosine synthase